VLAGRYQIAEPLGAGGMGEVYQAHDAKLNRRVAIKVLPAHLAADPFARERLRREAMSTAALDHPFICKVFEIGEDGGALFVAMELVSGETLRRRLLAGRLPVAEALRIACEVAEALEEAHKNRLVHRDLKPANVMLTQQGRVKVMDFGLAKRFAPDQADQTAATLTIGERDLTLQGSSIGTPDYMSPEQVRGEQVDQRSDLFSFGILLCELLSGTHPFRQATIAETMAAILRDPPRLAAAGAGELAPGLMVLIRRLLAKQPAERYQSMSEVRSDLAHTAALPAANVGESESDDVSMRIPLIGRDPERAALLRHLDEALAGRGTLVLIGGEPGIGKTHLAGAILAEAQRRGSFTVVGHCYEQEGSPPYVPFVEMLEYSARVAPPETFRFALGDSAPEVAKLLPELRRMFPGIPAPIELPPEQQRRFLFNAYRDFVERSARLTPIVAVFEDLHWADEPTLQLLQHMVQTVATVPTLMIGTYRDVEVEATRPFIKTLETLVRQKQVSRMLLRRLPLAGVEAMLGSMSGQAAPASLARIVFDGTEGNPFFVEEVFRHLAEEGKLFNEQGAWQTAWRLDHLEVPEGVRLVIARRLERLGGEARRVLTTAAVIGRTFSLPLLEALEDTQPDAVLDAVEEAERAHLVAPESAGREPRYGFVHELIRQTLAGTLSVPRRQRLHARVAEAIERVYAPSLENQAPALAHHLYQAGAAADPEKAITYLVLAARRAREAAAHEEVLTHLDNALALCEGERGRPVAELQSQRAAALRNLGRTDEALQAYEQAIALFDASGETVKSVETSIPLFWTLAWSADARWKVVSDRALACLGDADQALRCHLWLNQALGYAQEGDIDAGLRAFHQAGEIRKSLRFPALDRHAFHVEMILRWFTLDFAVTDQASRHASAAYQAAGDAWGQVEAESFELVAAVYLGRLADVGRRIPGVAQRAERIGHQAAVWVCKLVNSLGLAQRGDLPGAERATHESLAFARSFQNGWAFFDEISLGIWTQYRGRTGEAIACFHRAIEAEPVSAASGLSRSTLFLALAQEGAADALDVLNKDAPRLPIEGTETPAGAWGNLANVVEGLASLGRDQDAAVLHPWTEKLAAKSAWFWVNPRLFRTTAGIAAACARNWARSEEHHRAAIQMTDATHYRVSQAIARDWYARMLIARGGTGDRLNARSVLSEALSLYESLGMPEFGRRAGHRLASLA
jgi:tetratricopeptide (TPR) repeat protein